MKDRKLVGKRLFQRLHTELDEEFEEATDIEGNVRDKFAVLPISLHSNSHIHRVGDPTRSGHLDTEIKIQIYAVKPYCCVRSLRNQ